MRIFITGNYYVLKLLVIIKILALFSLSLVAQTNFNSPLISSGVLGQSGLVLIPTAHLSADRSLSIGSSFVPRSATVRKVSSDKDAPEMVNFARINFLPFLELSIRFTKTEGINELGDRSIFARVQILQEKKHWPAIAIGAHDLFGQVPHYHSVYAVASKQWSIKERLVVNGHLGYGVKTREQVKNTQLLGVFGGTTIRYRFVETGIEYDGQDANMLLKLFYKKWLSISANLLNMKQLGGTAAVYFKI